MSDTPLQMGRTSAQDIASQTIGWRAALDAVRTQAPMILDLWGSPTVRHVVITGCGSPFFLGSTAQCLLAGIGGIAVPITVLPADEIRRAPLLAAPAPDATVLIVITRSGTTSEVLEAVESFRAVGGRRVCVVTCRSGSDIVAVADLAITIDEGFESSVAQTRSFSSMLVAIQSMAAVLGGHDLAAADGLPEVGRDAIDLAIGGVDALDLGDATARIDFVGSAENYGLAREAMLKMSEMALTSSAAYHVLEYRHGPISMTDRDSLLVGLLTAADADRERSVLADVERLGGRTLTLDDSWLPPAAQGLPPWARPVLRMPALQLLAHRRALVMGLDPDQPPHLTPVIHLPGGPSN